MGTRGTAIVAAIALTVAGCADDGGTDVSPTTSAAPTTTVDAGDVATTTSTTTPAENGTGVSDDAIQLGFIGLDLDTLRELGLVDINRGDYFRVVDTFVDELNARGGINGRLIEAHAEVVSPVDLPGADETCLRLTQDVEVFAVLGGFVGPTADANTCFATEHDTILIGGTASPGERAEATAPWLTFTAGTERHLPAAIRLLDEAGLLGERVGIGYDVTEEEDAIDFILPALTSIGREPVEVFVQGTQGGDTVAGASEWQVFSERADQNDVDTMLFTEVTGIFGLQQMIANGFEGQLVVVDTIGNTASTGTASFVPLEALEGIVGTGFLDSPEVWEQPATQECIAVFEAANPDIEVVRSDEVGEGEPDWLINILGVCNALRAFELASTAAGDVLNHDTFLAGVAQIGPFEIAGRGSGFFGEGRYDSANEIRVVEFDVDDLPDGGSKPFGPMTPIDDILG